MIAFANANGGVLLLGVADDGLLQGMSQEQMAALSNLVVEVSTDSIEPALRIDVHHRELESKAFVVVEVPRGDSLHERGDRSWLRVGASKRRLTSDERMRLAHRRAQARYLWFDRQAVPSTGFETLSERLWGPLLSVAGATDPIRGLANMRLLVRDEADVLRATVAGVLVCARMPQEWLPHAVMTATHYRGGDRASEQLDAQEIDGPLQSQIADGMKFVARNMRVAPPASHRRARTCRNTARPQSSRPSSMPWRTATTRCLRDGSGFRCSRIGLRSIHLDSSPTG